MRFSAKRILLTGLALAIISGGVYMANLIWFKPFRINHFFERIFLEYALEDPELLTMIKPPFVDKVSDYQSKLTDASPAFMQKRAAMNDQNLLTLLSYKREELNLQEQLSYDVLAWFLQNNKEGAEFLFHDYPLNQLSGIQNTLPTFLISSHTIKTVEDADGYVNRLRAFPEKFDQVMEGLKLREQKNIIPPDFVIEKVLKEMREFIAHEPMKHPLYTAFADKCAKVEVTEIHEKKQAEYLAMIAEVLQKQVYPTYQKLIDYYSTLLPKTGTHDGVWKLPNGDKYYAWCLRRHTTTDLSADEIHQMGLEEVRNIQTEIVSLVDSAGLYSTGSAAQLLEKLAKDSTYFYPDTEEGRKECLAQYQAMIDDAFYKMEGPFPILPKAKVKVKRVPEFREGTSAGAYYEPPAMDGSREGVFFVNLRDMKEIPQWGMRTLAYHEAVPGHHFQIAIQQELKGVPTFRKVLPFTAYAEGWALYAEQLMYEMGFHTDLNSQLGFWQAQLFRAVRLVVDTGIHSRCWSREEAIAYMMENTGMPEAEVTTEVERYIVDPGQACAYKVGQMKILELRSRAKNALGKNFNIQAFHEVILKNGSMPLDILEKEVDKYIALQRKEAA